MQTEEFVKIGITNNLQSRWKQVQTGCPLHIYRVSYLSVGNRDEALSIEAELHSRLSPYNTFGEWFIIRRSKWLNRISAVIKKYGYSKEDIRLLEDRDTLSDKSKSFHLRYLSINAKVKNSFEKISLLSVLKTDIETLPSTAFIAYTKPELIAKCNTLIDICIKEISDTPVCSNDDLPIMDSLRNAELSLKNCICEADLKKIDLIEAKYPELAKMAYSKRQKIQQKVLRFKENHPLLSSLCGGTK